nr:uncharacterized protein LOC107451359 [Parasteatoda tepidariorum]
MRLGSIWTCNSRSSNAPEVPLSLALETLNNRFPEPEWPRVYTDGSFSNNQPNAGAGVFSELFSFYAPIGSFRTAFDGVVSAIRMALQQLVVLNDKFQNAVILSDSRASIQSICSILVPSSRDILDCLLSIKKLEQLGKATVLQWVPAHCGLSGNERAAA